MEAKHLQVIAEFKQGLRQGLKALYECYGRHLYQFSMKNWELDEDECYEILYKTLETVGKVVDRYEYSSEKHFMNWLFKIHKNNTLMFVRSKNARETVEFTVTDWENEYKEIAAEDDEHFGENPITEIASNSAYEENQTGSPLFNALEKALQTIDESDRDLLILRMNNYSYEEIAQMLGVESGHLKMKFSRAKAKVQKKTMEIFKENSDEKK